MWLGIDDFDIGSFVPMDGSDLSYSNWETDEDSETNRNENGVSIKPIRRFWKNEPSGSMLNAVCTLKLKCMFEFKLAMLCWLVTPGFNKMRIGNST